MMKILINLFVAFIELYAIFQVCWNISKEKNVHKLYLSILSLIYVLFAIVATLYFHATTLMIFVNILLLYFITYSFKIENSKRIFITLIFYALSMATEMIVIAFLSSILNLPPSDFQTTSELYFVAFMISKFLLVVIVKVWANFNDKNNVNDIKKFALISLIIPVLTLIVLVIIANIIIHTTYGLDKFMLTFVSFLLIVMNIIMWIYNDLLAFYHQTRQEVQKEMILLKKQKDEYLLMIENQLRTNKEIHELKHKVFTLKEYVESDKSKAIEIIDDIYNIYQRKEIKLYTSLKDVDALLNAKDMIAREKGLNINYKIKIDTKLKIDSMDLCIIMGNILDNAIENYRLGFGNNEINVELKTRQSFLAISCENCTDKLEVGINKSTKENHSKMHGYGLSKIQEIAKKYGGNMYYNIENGKFKVCIILCICQSHQKSC